MSKTIIFCADGTWNGPDQDDDHDGTPDCTNVYKLFIGLQGDLSVDTIRDADEQEKVLSVDGTPTQVAKYIHGVGDSRNPIRSVLGGAFGAGIIARIVRGYTFISRNYENGDVIVLVGFSRGAYTVRALAGLIASQGLLSKDLTQNKEEAYRWGGNAWYRYRRKALAANRRGLLNRLAEAIADLPAFVSAGKLKDEHLVKVQSIKAVAVWDTVGSLGIPTYQDDQRIDAFRFTDNELSKTVERGFHAVSLDEQRADFVPTLWKKRDDNTVIQTLFPGAHADVGGGYPSRNNECGLSNGALLWMVEQLKGIGVQFTNQIRSTNPPDAAGVAHQPWKHPPFNFAATKARDFRGEHLGVHPSVDERMTQDLVVAEPGTKAVKYRPVNRPIQK